MSLFRSFDVRETHAIARGVTFTRSPESDLGYLWYNRVLVYRLPRIYVVGWVYMRRTKDEVCFVLPPVQQHLL